MNRVLISVGFITLLSSFAFAEDISRIRTVEEFFKQNTDLRVSDEAVGAYLKTLNEMSLKVIQKATQIAKEDKRQTILDRDINKASDEVFRRAPITVAELMEKVTQLSIIDLSELASRVRAYANSLIEKKK